MFRYLSPFEVTAAIYFKLDPIDLRTHVLPAMVEQEADELLAELVGDYLKCHRYRFGMKRGTRIGGRGLDPMIRVIDEKRHYLREWCRRVGAEQRRRLGFRPLPQDAGLSADERSERQTELFDRGYDLAIELGYVRPGTSALRIRAMTLLREAVARAIDFGWDADTFAEWYARKVKSYYRYFVSVPR